jgi:hypothetical protein
MKRICDPSSGKLANTVYLIGRNGQVVRTRVVPANPKTTAQTLARANFTLASQGWDLLSQSEQLAWIAAAAGYQSKSRLGMSGPLTGNQFYVKINANLLQNGDVMVDVPPSVPAFDPIPATALLATNPGGVGTLKITTTDAWSDTTRVSAAAPVKNGVHRVPQLLDIGEAPVSQTNASNITALYAVKYGNPPAGSKVFIGLSQTLDGFDGPMVTFWAIIPAST